MVASSSGSKQFAVHLTSMPNSSVSAASEFPPEAIMLCMLTTRRAEIHGGSMCRRWRHVSGASVQASQTMLTPILAKMSSSAMRA
jgi:hypothetical protein